MDCNYGFGVFSNIYYRILYEGVDMITLDYFLQNEKIVDDKNIYKGKIFQSKTRKEYTEKDLPTEIRKNINGWIEKIEKMDLTNDQRKLVDLIKNGANIKLQKGKKKENIQIVKPYSPYLILMLYKSLRVRK